MLSGEGGLWGNAVHCLSIQQTRSSSMSVHICCGGMPVLSWSISSESNTRTFGVCEWDLNAGSRSFDRWWICSRGCWLSCHFNLYRNQQEFWVSNFYAAFPSIFKFHCIKIKEKFHRKACEACTATAKEKQLLGSIKSSNMTLTLANLRPSFAVRTARPTQARIATRVAGRRSLVVRADKVRFAWSALIQSLIRREDILIPSSPTFSQYNWSMSDSLSVITIFLSTPMKWGPGFWNVWHGQWPLQSSLSSPSIPFIA